MTAAPQPPEDLVPPEEHSTGTAWHAPHPPAPVLPAHITPCTPGQQAKHREQLVHAISGFAVGRALSRTQARADVQRERP
ncbi:MULTISPECIES: hypothetical protein [Streptomyces]